MEEAYHLSSSRAFLHHDQQALFLTSNLFQQKCHLCDWKMRSVKRHPWELSFSTICSPSWYLDWRPAWSSVSLNLSGFITSSLNSRSTLCLEKSQRPIKVVVNALSLFSRIFRPTMDSAETSGSWRRQCHNTGREKKVRHWEKWILWQCTCRMSSSSWMNRCVSLRLQTLFS